MKLTVPNVATMSRRERVMISVSALVMCVVLLDRLVLGPWWRHTARVRKEIHRLEEDIRVYHQLLTRAPLINREVDAYAPYRRPDSEAPANLAALLREIESLGSQGGVSLGEVKPTEGATNPLYTEYAVDVEFRGSLEQAVHFLHLLQSSKLLFTLERATVERSRDEVGMLDASLRLQCKVTGAATPAAPAAGASKQATGGG
jgi:hypothetical protein